MMRMPPPPPPPSPVETFFSVSPAPPPAPTPKETRDIGMMVYSPAVMGAPMIVSVLAKLFSSPTKSFSRFCAGFMMPPLYLHFGPYSIIPVLLCSHYRGCSKEEEARHALNNDMYGRPVRNNKT